MTQQTTNVGSVVQIIGPVLDIEFPAGQLPKVFNSTIVQDGDKTITCEVQVRCVSVLF